MIGDSGSWTPAALLACAVLGGCAHRSEAPAAMSPIPAVMPSPHVGVKDVSEFAAPSGRLVLADNETFILPLPALDNARPTYPQRLLAQRLPPQVVCVEVGVGMQGEIMSAAPIAPAAECPLDGPDVQAARDQSFFDAAREAVLQWHFEAAFRCEYPNVAARVRQDCSGGRETAQAVSLTYRFIFQQSDGRGSVRQAGDAK